MRVLMLDTHREEDLDEIEAVRRITARVAVEAPLGANNQPTPESAVLDRSVQTMTKPRPQPKTAPTREKRRRKRR